MLILHQFHLSPYNQKLQRMLNYKGIPYTEKYWLLGERKQVRAMNPVGKLPALEHDGKIVADSTDAAHYIEEQFPHSPMIPAEPDLRGQVHVFEDWADESLYFYEMHLRFTTPGNRERNIPRMVEHENRFLRWLLPRVIPGGIARITATQGIGRKSIDQLLIDVQRHVRAVDDLLTGADWLVGNRITLADLAVFGMFQALQDADMAADIITRFPRVCSWLQRIEQNTGTPTSQPS
ncbi:glutathione S-transferase family protein [Pseudohalioglobus lutimaris]|uniref:Glutathione S-transferase family protein n=1 Tax=Pseudohalioglobus lutimaris TaxID=1737061 RepID=A0A2N5X8E4_9GAMM|nr:glutathione S-transferase family protein [Pseudohalioglobus lutimaris]PLW70738.1 glutathione S-transferase family protein [Pseudohalioglobus lutimaris]